jgi:hypothetical protein
MISGFTTLIRDRRRHRHDRGIGVGRVRDRARRRRRQWIKNIVQSIAMLTDGATSFRK